MGNIIYFNEYYRGQLIEVNSRTNRGQLIRGKNNIILLSSTASVFSTTPLKMATDMMFLIGIRDYLTICLFIVLFFNAAVDVMCIILCYSFAICLHLFIRDKEKKASPFRQKLKAELDIRLVGLKLFIPVGLYINIFNVLLHSSG